MSEVLIVGVGQTSVGEHWDYSLRELALHAIEAVIEDSGGLRPQALYVGNMLAPALSSQSHLATLVADFAGLRGVEATVVEAAGATGGVALRAGYLAVLSGQVDVALVVGVEKLSDRTASEVDAAIATASDSDYEAEQGLTQTAQAALLMQRYLHEFEVPEGAFAGFPVTAHANGASNPNAMFRKAIKPESYARAGMVSAPLNMFDIAPPADGAAAALLVRSELVPPKFPHKPVGIAASSVATDTLALHDRPDPLEFGAARHSVAQACQRAGIDLEQIDLFEVFDAYSIYTALSLEAAGFAERGQGWQWARDGAISLDGELPLMTFGGLKARGYPGGATGVYQVVEAVQQLRGQAGDNQVPDAEVALVQALGGPASTAATHVLRALD